MKFYQQIVLLSICYLCASGDKAGDLQVAMILSQSMNATVDPCNDFYEFMCGNYSVKSSVFK
jgi:hypothetical protein